MATLHLNIRDVLLKAREAFNEGRLQCQQPEFQDPDNPQGCLYTGPCAIGAAIPHHIAVDLDGPMGDSNSIDELFEAGRVTSDAPDDLASLQCAHDNCYTPEGFEGTLIMLEGKYGLR